MAAIDDVQLGVESELVRGPGRPDSTELDLGKESNMPSRNAASRNPASRNAATDRTASDSRATTSDRVRVVARWALGATLLLAGTGHLTVQRDEFQAQVPGWFPVDDDAVVLVSGVVELLLGAALILAGRRRHAAVGLVVAGFFVVIFPGNIAQFVEHQDGFGLDTDAKRFVRLLFQPVLVLWALWSTGAWASLRTRRSEGS